MVGSIFSRSVGQEHREAHFEVFSSSDEQSVIVSFDKQKQSPWKVAVLLRESMTPIQRSSCVQFFRSVSHAAAQRCVRYRVGLPASKNVSYR